MRLGHDWSVSGIWNASLETKTERPQEPRDHIWASELDRSPVDIFLRMRGVTESNPPNARSNRKFESGHLHEWLVEFVLQRCGILKETQTYTTVELPGMLKVTGRADFMAGGIPDYSEWERWEQILREVHFPEFLLRNGERIREYFEKTYPQGIAEEYIEVKSVSERMFTGLEARGKGLKSHRMQLFHYLYGNNYPKGRLFYECKDDLRLLEVPVMNPSSVEDEYRAAIEVFTAFYNAHKDTPLEDFIEFYEEEGVKSFRYHPLPGMPPLEKPIVFDPDLGKFSRNYNVEYSGYLTALYGFKQPKEVEDFAKPVTGRWNRVLTRVKNGQTMTKNNLEALDEIKASGFDLEAILAQFTDSEEEDAAE